ncbi:MAG: lipopolysaccharide heptosyltransferase I [Gammaproteobacteria bacterium RIFCSPHIGHO2_12_FULL_38_14]|nr:MAG: lipopolysaccharide heptosyltransferase I [Gammaproteobacteria bacterium RIFCSPHIGHO2_12_FULL_38_14]
MMRVLLVKTSSMGDVIHTLPALTDAGNAHPEIQFDWLIEESFVDIPRWHPTVNDIIPVALRRWRKNILSKQTNSEWKQLRHLLREKNYDLILDAQGLIKSAFLTWLAKGKRAGLHFKSARESLASLFYHHRYQLNETDHAVWRMRSLFSQALGYQLPKTPADFGFHREQFPKQAELAEPYVVFLHATTWTSKLWPEPYWVALMKRVIQQGYRVKIGGGNHTEIERAKRIAGDCDAVDLVPRLSIAEMAALLAHARAAVAVDTGFGHLSAALTTPTISIYGSTDPSFTGAIGKQSIHLAASFPCSPCFARTCTYKQTSIVKPACYETVGPDRVWEALKIFL